MSVLDAFFNKGFKATKCKTLLKLTIPRIKLLRNRREIQLKQMRRDIAKLLENGQEATARIRVEHIIREENMMAAQEIIELFCELIAVRLSIIETQRECPLDLKEAISSICFAAPRCSDLPELQQVQMLFAAKYGREFVAAASELLPDCGVNRQIIELLSVRAPSVEARLKLLKEIAEEHEVEWDPVASETEFLKPHEDLLNGPNFGIKDHILPLSEEIYEEPPPYLKTEEHHEGGEEKAESEEDFDSLNLPEVPKASVRTTSETSPSAPGLGHINTTPSNNTANEFNDPYYSTKETKQYQYVPFVAPPPPQIPFSSPVEENDSTPPISTNFPSPSEKNDPSPPFSPPRFSPPLERNDLNPGLFSNLSSPSEKNDGAPFSHDKIDTTNVDLQDVLAAAQAAADSADRAAQAARAAASLAQIRIAGLAARKNPDTASETSGKKEAKVTEKPVFDQQDSFDYRDQARKYDDGESDYMHQPQRSVSMEDDPYSSYPNLFNRQNSAVMKRENSLDEHSKYSQ